MFKNHPLYGKHDLDSATQALWNFYKSNFLVLFLISVVFSIGMQLISSGIDISSISGMQDPMAILEEMKKWTGPLLIVFSISIVQTLVLQYFVIFRNSDENFNIASLLFKPFKYLIPYIIVMILFAVFAMAVMAAGLVVFIVGVFFSVLYVFMIAMFILPVLMTEGNNISNAIARTFSLSHRHFGQNLGYTTLLVLFLIIISIILSALIMIPFSGSFLKIFNDPENAGAATEFVKNPYYIVLSGITSSLITPLMPILAALLYFNARAREENEIITPEDNQPVKVEDLYAKPWADDHPDNPEKRQE